MLPLGFHPAVYEEIATAYGWYEQQLPGLGEDFVAELDAAFEAIARLPLSWPVYGPNSRRFLLSRFPYAVLYNASASCCFVLAVMHQRRKPDYWQART